MVDSIPPPQIAPKKIPTEPDSYIPSKASIESVTPSITRFRDVTVATPYSGDKQILVLCTTKYLLECQNGKFFNTGHQATETLLPMYHLDRCGFQFDIATPDGAGVAIEEWTFPSAVGYEQKLREIQAKCKTQLEKPKKYAEIPLDLSPYAAVFLPGGHGPVIEQHQNAELGALLRSANKRSVPTMSICHGPTMLRAAALGGGQFPYKGYKVVVFPDSVDDMLPQWGYLPGLLKPEDHVEARLRELGMLVQNKEMDDSTCVDRELITGASQVSSQAFSELVVRTLAEKYGFKVTI